MENPHVAKCDFITALHKVSPSLKKGLSCHVDLKGVLWEDIGGLEDVKAEIQQARCVKLIVLTFDAFFKVVQAFMTGLLHVLK